MYRLIPAQFSKGPKIVFLPRSDILTSRKKSNASVFFPEVMYSLRGRNRIFSSKKIGFLKGPKNACTDAETHAGLAWEKYAIIYAMEGHSSAEAVGAYIAGWPST